MSGVALCSAMADQLNPNIGIVCALPVELVVRRRCGDPVEGGSSAGDFVDDLVGGAGPGEGFAHRLMKTGGRVDPGAGFVVDGHGLALSLERQPGRTGCWTCPRKGFRSATPDCGDTWRARSSVAQVCGGLGGGDRFGVESYGG